nr:PREDICTED: uncharacterized protein LOC109030529 [Bemisia tabaci]
MLRAQLQVTLRLIVLCGMILSYVTIKAAGLDPLFNPTIIAKLKTASSVPEPRSAQNPRLIILSHHIRRTSSKEMPKKTYTVASKVKIEDSGKISLTFSGDANYRWKTQFGWMKLILQFLCPKCWE